MTDINESDFHFNFRSAVMLPPIEEPENVNISRALIALTLTISGVGLAAGYATAESVEPHAVANPAPNTSPIDQSNAPLQIDDAHDPQTDFNNAIGVAANQVGLAATAGAIAGTAVGVAIGCPLGAVTAGFTALPTGPIALPAAALGCVAGASIGIGIGAAIGTAVVAGPVGVASAVQVYNTLHAAGDIAGPVPSY
ncbi:MAG: hypothetical protein JWN03_8449 [Nocardia sp.]|uniref:hypothetical protein n=1 Tax=Nocardia sp. TaxID=1821 RepID=UPI002607FDC0|nr:hypothetical protein [Nocardia sp.]MCU1648174.1 hypothetical protein [Nocardia sp.]